jgi:sulfoxide reductase heme-binding subunit YedZ
VAARSVADRAAPWLVALACALPFAHLVFRLFTDDLGVNPIEELTRELGVWGLRLLLLDLAITPAAQLLRQPRLIRFRRPIGLMAFFYVLMHLSTFIGLDHFFDWAAIWKEILKRPFITIGMAGFVLLLPLVFTSTNAMIRRVGPRTWRRIHQAIYLIAILGVLHYFLLVKADKTMPLIYGAIAAVLLGYRVWRWMASRAPRPKPA